MHCFLCQKRNLEVLKICFFFLKTCTIISTTFLYKIHNLRYPYMDCTVSLTPKIAGPLSLNYAPGSGIHLVLLFHKHLQGHSASPSRDTRGCKHTCKYKRQERPLMQSIKGRRLIVYACVICWTTRNNQGQSPLSL